MPALAALPPVRPRLIGLDLDGTVLDNRGELRDDMLAALYAVRAAGIELAFLTGRRPRTARLALERFDAPALVCTNSGCLSWDYPGWNQLGVRLFPSELIAELVELLAPYSVNLYTDADADGPGCFLLQRDTTPELATAHGRYGAGTQWVTALAELGSAPVTQLTLPCSPELAVELRERVAAHFGARVLALAVRWPLVPCVALEVYHPDAHKGSALADFATRLDIPQAAVLAAGDDSNDLAMLRWAGFGVAMPHAQQEVRDAADITLSGEDSQTALAEYLRRLAAM